MSTVYTIELLVRPCGLGTAGIYEFSWSRASTGCARNIIRSGSTTLLTEYVDGPCLLHPPQDRADVMDPPDLANAYNGAQCAYDAARRSLDSHAGVGTQLNLFYCAVGTVCAVCESSCVCRVCTVYHV